MQERIVVIDDQEFVVDFTRCFLEDAGFTNIETFTDPVRALESFSDGAPAVVISDYNMPGINGLELLERASRINSHLYGMILTAEPHISSSQGVPVFNKDNSSYEKLIHCIHDHLDSVGQN